MKARSLSVFRTKLRQDAPGTVLVAVGQIIEGDEEHLRALARNRLVALIDEGQEETPPAATPHEKTTPAQKSAPKRRRGGK